VDNLWISFLKFFNIFLDKRKFLCYNNWVGGGIPGRGLLRIKGDKCPRPGGRANTHGRLSTEF